MKTSSTKQKGRLLQQQVCQALYNTFAEFDLEPDDFTSRSMGAQGVDIIITPAGKKVVGKLAIECKNKETINVALEFKANADKYPGQTALLFHKKNKYPILVTMRADEFMEIYKDAVKNRRIQRTS